MVEKMVENRGARRKLVGESVLRLGNGQGWQLASTLQVRSEVRELAKIMGLKSLEANGYPKLIFIRRGLRKAQFEETIVMLSKDTKDIAVGLPMLGWKAHDLWLLRIWSHNDCPDLICEITDEESGYEASLLSMRLSLYPIYQRAQDSGGLPLHAGLVERDGKGILLAGSRNTGKSTCCRRIPYPWHSLCDEEALIVRDDQQEYLAHPFPTWSEHLANQCKRTWSVENCVPVSAIFFLEQAVTDEVIHLGQGEAAALINQSATQVFHRFWNNLDREKVRSLKEKLLDNACQLAKSLQAFKLRVSVTGRFWEKIEAVSS
jgi:SynChlorMet cassette protein ScmC